VAVHRITADFKGGIEIGKVDLKIVVRKNGAVFGTLTLSKGTIDWRPKKWWRGYEKQMSWSEFDAKMRQ